MDEKFRRTETIAITAVVLCLLLVLLALVHTVASTTAVRTITDDCILTGKFRVEDRVYDCTLAKKN